MHVCVHVVDMSVVRVRICVCDAWESEGVHCVFATSQRVNTNRKKQNDSITYLDFQLLFVFSLLEINQKAKSLHHE